MESRYRYISLDANRNEIENNLHSYLEFLIIIGLFYITPSTQFIFFQANNNVSCYYNFECKYEYGIIPSLNSFVSNIFYVLLGFIYLITVKLKKHNNEDALMSNKSLYYCMGICLIYEGIASSFYHICPSKLNLQFDTTFMFIGIVMSYLCLYNNRHLGHVCQPLKFYLILFLVMVLNILSLIKNKNSTHWWLWVFTFVIVLYCLVLTSIYIFIGKSYELDLESLKEAYSLLKDTTQLKSSKFLFIASSNIITLTLFLYASITNSYFIGCLLFIGICNLGIYFSYYLLFKTQNNEVISNKLKISIILDMVLFISALYFYFNTNYNTFIDKEESKKLNAKCILFNFFDNHDVWHCLSALALYLFMNIILFIDDNNVYTLETINF